MRIGVFCPNWVGDGVMALPFFNVLRGKYPDAVILAICKSWVVPVFQNHPTIDEIVSFRKKDLTGLRSTRNVGRSLAALDLDSFYLLSDSYRAAFLAKRSEAPKRIGYIGQGRSPLLTYGKNKPKDPLHRYQYYLNLLGKENINHPRGPGIHLLDSEINWAKEELSQLGLTGAAAFFPFSVATSRTIPQLKSLEIIEKIGSPIIIFGGKSDLEEGEILQSASNRQNVRSVAGHYSLRNSMALISQCNGAIAVDSGLGHISANLNVSTISLFGAGNPSSTAPLGSQTKVIWEKVHCSPCLKNQCYNLNEPLMCLEQIEASSILNALDKI